MENQHFQAAHYGEVPEELLGYFKSVESKLDDQSFESAEDQRLFVDNVYTEVEGNELRLATNYSCSLVLEKLLKISDSFQLRVFMDKLSGSTIPLFAHRFASHVCQTLLTLAADVVDQEMVQGVQPNQGEQAENDQQGVLLTMQELVLGMCEDLKPSVGGLISQQFASHVIRVLLYVLAGKRVDESGESNSRLRTKKSHIYKAENNNVKNTRTGNKHLRVPNSFKEMFRSLTKELAMNGNEAVIRSLAVHRVASPLIQVLLELQDDSEEGRQAQTALLDSLLWGIVSDVNPADERKKDDRKAWFQTLIRDKAGSHLLEMVVKVAPDNVYDQLYKTYLAGNLEKFGLNPVSNFVIQQLISNVRTPAQVQSMVSELAGKPFTSMLKNGKYGVIRSLVDASVKVQGCYKQVVDALVAALGMTDDTTQQKQFVDCVIRMKTLDNWNNLLSEEQDSLRNFHLQGSLILQGIMKMPAEQNAFVVNSFLSMKPAVSLRWCYTPMGSRVVESIIASQHVNDKIKKKLLKNLLGEYVSLSKDKFGSHIVETCWSVADIEIKEKIARELVKYEYDLSEHHLGKCILWSCKIDLFKRHYNEWVEREKGVDRKKDMFKDILGDDVKMPKKRQYRSY
ncbi:armadillo-type protein [Halteromyces radiatus]|uniref:armadillo-type protein n=1 Tax=Halteromyces radiatus TaxID=101107 RepID=UPI00221EB246|nr:armadillo-type protein [Halteromyces radiatus]KAI8079723.1 armadillo-type protein [Halteromyces radiatus]